MDEVKNKYKLIIIGAGAAGLTASIYASRYKVDHLIISQDVGGTIFQAHKICNFPSEIEISGMDLINKIQKHTEALGASTIMDKITNIKKEGKLFKITTRGKKVFLTEAILLATGTEHRKMNLPDENKFMGKGLSYCATCDAMFYRDKTVAVVGGSDAANTTSLYLAEIAKKVYQIYRKDKLRGVISWIDQIKKNNKIEVIYNTEVAELKGENKLEKIILSKPYNNSKEIVIDGLFVEIGAVPQKMLIEQLSLDTNEKNYIKVGPDQKTNQSGIWAAGDVTDGSNNFRQIVTACSEGAVAAQNIFQFFQLKNK